MRRRVGDIAAGVVLAVALCLLVPNPSAAAPSRMESPLNDELSDRAGLLFRALDTDRDRFISEEDAQKSEGVLRSHMPGVAVQEFVSFIALADQNGDNKLSRDELFHGLAKGLSDAETVADSSDNADAESLVEVEAAESRSAARMHAQTHSKSKGPLGDKFKRLLVTKPRNGADAAWLWKNPHITSDPFRDNKNPQAAKLFTNLRNTIIRSQNIFNRQAIDTTQDPCIMCQYIVEVCERAVKDAAVNEVYGSASATYDPYAVNMLEMGSDTTASESEPTLVEVDSKATTETGTEHFPHAFAAGGIARTQEATRQQRQLQRQNYNEIYRLVDLALDGVCEQSMPNKYYGYCKQVYSTQKEVVSGLRYQYRPSDICTRTGMCSSVSYLAWGIHSRYV